jgi:hypothetical protein
MFIQNANYIGIHSLISGCPEVTRILVQNTIYDSHHFSTSLVFWLPSKQLENLHLSLFLPLVRQKPEFELFER